LLLLLGLVKKSLFKTKKYTL